MIGYIDSIETLGLVDGPGIRIVVFMKGCKLRCKYCHNPETWTSNSATIMTSDELLKKIMRYQPYFKENGGVTFSGGEPLLQKEFLIDILKKCKQNHIHTCLDTAGVGNNSYEEILTYVDLVILDIKALEEKEYKNLTNHSIQESTEFLSICQKLKKKLWIRQVIIPGINDTIENILNLKNFIQKLQYIEKIELLPYHTYGISKYQKLKIPYPLKNTKDMDKKRCQELQDILEMD